MKLKVKDMDIATGGVQIVLLNENDARKLDLHHEDRVIVKKGNKITVAVLDIAESEKAVPIGQIGVFEEVLDALNTKQNDIIELDITEKPETVKLIKKKMDGIELTHEEIYEIVQDIVDSKLTAIELTYFVSAIYTKKLSLKETVLLTKAMIDTGCRIDFKKKPIVDLHCIGGVPGNRTTMIVVPIIMAAGLTIPKTSSRAITSPAGTADTMEVLTNVNLSIDEIKRAVKKTNGCIIWGGSVNLAPADDKIIKIEHPLSIDPEHQLLASIMAKKGSVSATHVLIDIPIGKKTKIKTKTHAMHLKGEFEKIGKALKMNVKCVFTDGSQPVGNGIGPSLEARDVLWILKGDERAPKDLIENSLALAGKLLEMTKNVKNGRKIAADILKSGKAYQKFMDMVDAQGAKIKDIGKLKIGKHTYDFVAEKSGAIKEIDNKEISKLARIAGAPEDVGAGIYLHKHVGDKVAKGEKIYTFYADNPQKLQFAKNLLKKMTGIVVG